MGNENAAWDCLHIPAACDAAAGGAGAVPCDAVVDSAMAQNENKEWTSQPPVPEVQSAMVAHDEDMDWENWEGEWAGGCAGNTFPSHTMVSANDGWENREQDCAMSYEKTWVGRNGKGSQGFWVVFLVATLLAQLVELFVVVVTLFSLLTTRRVIRKRT